MVPGKKVNFQYERQFEANSLWAIQNKKTFECSGSKYGQIDYLDGVFDRLSEESLFVGEIQDKSDEWKATKQVRIGKYDLTYTKTIRDTGKHDTSGSKIRKCSEKLIIESSIAG